MDKSDRQSDPEKRVTRASKRLKAKQEPLVDTPEIPVKKPKQTKARKVKQEPEIQNTKQEIKKVKQEPAESKFKVLIIGELFAFDTTIT